MAGSFSQFPLYNHGFTYACLFKVILLQKKIVLFMWNESRNFCTGSLKCVSESFKWKWKWAEKLVTVLFFYS